MPGFFASFPSGSSGAAGVSSLNTLTGDLTLIGGAGITVTDGSGTITISASGGPFANTTLSNLDSPTAINQSLLPQSTNSFDIGAVGSQWRSLFVQTINDVSNQISIDVNSRFLIDSTGLTAVDFNGRELIGSDGTTILLNWNTTNSLDVNNHPILNVSDPTNPQDAATKNYVDTAGAGFALTNLSNLATPTAINVPLIFGATVVGSLKTFSTTTPGTPSPALTVTSGNATGTGSGSSSGAMTVSTGTSNHGTGSVTIRTGATPGNGSGNILLTTGTAGTNRGLIQFQNGTEGTIGQVWMTNDVSGSGHWGTTLSDATSLLALDWDNRFLTANDGASTALNWATPGTMDANTTRLINTSQVVIGGLTPASNNPGLTVINPSNNAAFFTNDLTASSHGMAFFTQVNALTYIQGVTGDFSANVDIGLQGNGGSVLIGTGTNTGDLLTVAGSVSVAGKIHNVTDPTSAQDAATKNYVDTHASGANTALSNLASVAINASLLPGTTNAIDIGATNKLWNSLYIGSSGVGISLFNGLNNPGIIFPNVTTPSGVGNVPSFYGTAGGTNFSVSMHTQTSSSANAVATGNVLIETGNKTAGTGNSGDIALTTGTSSGGTVGTIKLNSVTQIGTASTTLQHTLNTSSTTGAQVGTFTNVPGAAGPKNPTGYIQITINGTTSYIPYFQ